MKRTMIMGSGATLLKARTSKHIVSHTMFLDESVWKYRLDKDSKNEIYFDWASLSSPPFTAEDDGEVFFKIEFSKAPPQPLGHTSGQSADKMDKQLLIYLNLVSKPLPITVHFTGRFRHSDLNGPFAISAPPFGATAEPLKQKWVSGFRPVKIENVQMGFRVDVTYVKVGNEVDRQSTPVTSKNMVLPKRSIGSDMAYLLENPVASDVIIKGGDREWNLHKCVLSARSDVFAAMFASDMRENKIGVVQIKDVHASVLDLMIRFIYKDIDIDIDAVDQNTAEQLLILSDKYDLPVLQELCENRLISLLSIENCLRLCAFASKHNSQLLLTPAKTMLANNSVIICRRQTTEYKDFLKENSDLYIDMLLTKEPNSDK